jgi:HD-GYP domain-containing protein (c-di-GMP phosphodiesterase class II)
MIANNFLKKKFDNIDMDKKKIIFEKDSQGEEFYDLYLTSNHKRAVYISEHFPAGIVLLFNKNNFESLPDNVIHYKKFFYLSNKIFLENIFRIVMIHKNFYLNKILNEVDKIDEFYKIKILFKKIGFVVDIVNLNFFELNNLSKKNIAKRWFLVYNDGKLTGFSIIRKKKVFFFKTLWHSESEIDEQFLKKIIFQIKKLKFFSYKKEKFHILNEEHEFLSKYIGDSFFIQSINGKIIYSNENFKKNFSMYNKSLELNEVLINENKLLQNNIKINRPFSLVIAKSGSYGKKCYDITYSPIEENGKIIKFCGIIRDITLQKQLEEALKITNEKLSKVNKVLTSVQNETILEFSKLAEYKDRESTGHLDRIQIYVRLLTEEIHKKEIFLNHKTKKNYITAEYVEELSFSSLLHDIGKMGIPDSILNKKGKLTADELVEMQLHTKIGGDALNDLNEKINEMTFLSLAKEVAYCHHERWDGKGYPYGYKEEEIPISARIVSICDVYDALTSKRPYKEEYSHEKACDIIYNHSMTHFDPVIVSVFSSIQDDFRKIKKSFV